MKPNLPKPKPKRSVGLLGLSNLARNERARDIVRHEKGPKGLI
jgi:hypothetical protein